MKNNSDKNEKVVQTKGGFTYLENEKKALDDYLAQLAAESKAKTITQAKTTTIVNNNVQIKNESIVNKQNETFVTNKLCSDNSSKLSEKPQIQKVENIKLNNTRIDGSFVPSMAINTNEISNKNTLKPEVKPSIQIDTKQQGPNTEKREVPVQKFDKIDLITKNFDLNSIKDTNTNTGKDKSTVPEANTIKSNNIAGNNLVSSNISSNVKGNFSSFVPTVSSLTSKSPNAPVITTPQVNCTNLASTASSINEISKDLEKKNNNILSQFSLKKNIESSSLTKQEYNNQNNQKEEIKAEILKNETVKEIQIVTNTKQIKEHEANKNSELISVNKEKQEQQLLKDTNEDNSSNSIKENQVNPPINSSKKLETSVNNDSIKNNQEKLEYVKQKVEDKPVKNTVYDKSTEKDKPIYHSKPNKTEKESLLVESFKKIEENIPLLPTPAAIFENNGKNNDSNNENATKKPELNEVKESNLKPSKIIDHGNRPSMLEMMNKLDLKMTGAKNQVKLEAPVINKTNNQSISGKLEMSKKIQEMSRHMTQESKDSQAVSLELNGVQTTSEISTTINPPGVQTIIPSVPQIPVGIPKVPTVPIGLSGIPPVPNIPNSIPPIPKVPGIPPVPAIPKVPLPVSKNLQSMQTKNSDTGISISEQIAKGVQLKKVEVSESKIEKTPAAGTCDKRENKVNMNMFEEMKKLQLKKVHK